MLNKYFTFISLLLLFSIPSFAADSIILAGTEQSVKTPKPLPIYACELPNINDYQIF